MFSQTRNMDKSAPSKQCSNETCVLVSVENARVFMYCRLRKKWVLDAGSCKYDRITFGRCIQAQADTNPCDILEEDLNTQIGLCIGNMSINKID